MFSRRSILALLPTIVVASVFTAPANAHPACKLRVGFQKFEPALVAADHNPARPRARATNTSRKQAASCVARSPRVCASKSPARSPTTTPSLPSFTPPISGMTEICTASAPGKNWSKR
jgi:hypothetical protein